MAADVTRCPVAGFDTLSPEYLADPGAAFAEARRSCPVFYEETIQAWIVTGYDDVRAVLYDFETFSVEQVFAPVVPPAEFAGRLPQRDLFAATLLTTDPPEHTHMRRLMNKVFTTRGIAEQDPTVRRLANELIDEFVADGHCDLMNQFTNPLLWSVAVGLFGMPESDIQLLQDWRADILVLMAQGRAASGTPVAGLENELWSRIADGWEYFGDMLEDRRTTPRDDLASVLVAATDDDGKPAFTDDEIIMHTMGTVTAAVDTTANLIANIVVLLDEHPDAASAVRDDPERITAVIAEALRRQPSSVLSRRVATREVELAGTTIPAGSQVAVSLASANHDEERFADPQRFDIGRPNLHDQLGFGAGRHFCLGAPLARLASRAAVETLYQRIPGLRVPQQEHAFERLRPIRVRETLSVEWD